MNTVVALQKCEEYDFQKVYESLKKLVELVPPPCVKDKVVLLKPNILYPKKPELAVCTHPVVVGACVKLFVEMGAKKVLAGESPAIANSVSAAKVTGMYDQVVKNGGEWVDFHNKVTVEYPQGQIVKQLEFADVFAQSDILISLSKLKSHQLMAYTGAMKNLFGLMIGLEKAQSHYKFPDKADFGAFLTDIVAAAKPQYAIMDAIVGMDGPGGPGSGNPIKLNFLAASDNILALDWKCASLVGYNPHLIVNLENALNRKIWLNSPDEISVIGTPEEQLKNTNFKIVKEPAATLGKMIPDFIDALAKRILVRTPHVMSDKCQKCQKCRQICPAHIIEMNGPNQTAQLQNKNKCLHCYCCHEICPFGAIKLKRF